MKEVARILAKRAIKAQLNIEKRVFQRTGINMPLYGAYWNNKVEKYQKALREERARKTIQKNLPNTYARLYEK